MVESDSRWGITLREMTDDIEIHRVCYSEGGSKRRMIKTAVAGKKRHNTTLSGPTVVASR